jgi:hypothetical protein
MKHIGPLLPFVTPMGPLVALVGLLSLGCSGEPPVPAEPTWVDDVEPILHGNCFGCHGAGKRSTDAHRWDFFTDLSDGTLTQLGVPVDLVETRTEAVKWPVWLTLPTGDFMPPPPATRLSDRDVEVFRRFSLNPRRGTRVNNHKPTVTWYPKAPWILVGDADREQVLGKLRCGTVDVVIDHTGAQQLPAGAGTSCTGTLYDGQDVEAVTLR